MISLRLFQKRPERSEEIEIIDDAFKNLLSINVLSYEHESEICATLTATSAKSSESNCDPIKKKRNNDN